MQRMCIIPRPFSSWSAPDPSSRRNQPFAPADRRNAEELVSGNTEYDVSHEVGPVGIHSLRKTLVKSWMDVDTKTRPA